jgi:hypothetical protein
MHGTGKTKVGIVAVIMKGSVLKYLVKKVTGAVIMNRGVLKDLKGKKMFDLGIVIMQLRVLKYLVQRSGTVMWGPTTISQRERESVLFIGTQFSILYTSMYLPAEAATPRA